MRKPWAASLPKTRRIFHPSNHPQQPSCTCPDHPAAEHMVQPANFEAKPDDSRHEASIDACKAYVGLIVNPVR